MSGGTATVSEGQKIRMFEHFANERVRIRSIKIKVKDAIPSIFPPQGWQ